MCDCAEIDGLNEFVWCKVHWVEMAENGGFNLTGWSWPSKA